MLTLNYERLILFSLFSKLCRCAYESLLEFLRFVFRKEHNLEELLAGHVLLRLRNVYITPHSAFNTKEAIQRILDTTVENIFAFT